MAMNIHALADELVEQLRPGCERIEIAGSIRRGKADPKDIEIVCVPRLTNEMQELDLFGNVVDTIVCDHLHGALQNLYKRGAWELDGFLPRNGEKYKRLRHLASGICCDLFIANAANWGNLLAIRTGPSDFSQALVTRALRLGLKQDGGLLWRTHRDGTRTVIPCLTEESYFEALRVPFIPPHERTVEKLNRVLA
jgi:DNA polymerase/3'-5' exonuclease PolX